MGSLVSARFPFLSQSIYYSLYQRLTIQFSPKFQSLLYHSNQKQPVTKQLDLLRVVLIGFLRSCFNYEPCNVIRTNIS